MIISGVSWLEHPDKSGGSPRQFGDPIFSTKEEFSRTGRVLELDKEGEVIIRRNGLLLPHY